MKISILSLEQFNPITRKSARNFVMNSMHKTIYDNVEEFQVLDKKSFHKSFNLFLEELLKTGVVRIAVNADAPNEFLGYILYSPVTENRCMVYMIYTKHKFRGEGLAKHLFRKYCYDFDYIVFPFKTRAYDSWREDHQETPFKLKYSDSLLPKSR